MSTIQTAFWRFAACAAPGFLLLAAPQALSSENDDRSIDSPPQVQIAYTADGVRYGIAGGVKNGPAPTIFVFATSIEDTLPIDSYNRIGRLLDDQGWIAVSLDLPCHGADAQEGKPAGLTGWRKRLEDGRDFVAEFTVKAMAVLDDLVAAGRTDPDFVAAAGTSRGGFMALHLAARDPRVRLVAAFAPVTDLAALDEFAGFADAEAVSKLDLARAVDELAHREIWITIGNHDTRVDSTRAIGLVEGIIEAAVAKGAEPAIELHLSATVGHRTYDRAHDDAAGWMAGRASVAR